MLEVAAQIHATRFHMQGVGCKIIKDLNLLILLMSKLDIVFKIINCVIQFPLFIIKFFLAALLEEEINPKSLHIQTHA